MDSDRELIEGLSLRESACLRHVGEGMSSKEIAAELSLSPHTVDNYLRSAIQKLKARDRRDAARRFRTLEQLMSAPANQGSPDEASLTADVTSPQDFESQAIKTAVQRLSNRVNHLSLIEKVLAVAAICIALLLMLDLGKSFLFDLVRTLTVIDH